MRLSLAIIAFVCSAGLFPPVSTSSNAESLRDLVGKPFDARIVTVTDGDTVEGVRDGERLAIRIRLEGVDTPERGEPYSHEARGFTRALLFDKRVRVDPRDVDVYGRLVARVRLGARDTSIELLAAGLACHFTKYSHDATLARAQADARAAHRGFWADNAPKPRCVRASNFAIGSVTPTSAAARDRSAEVHGNTNSHVYHASWCPNYTCKNCTAVFMSKREADAAGFTPAQDCLKRK